MADDAGTVVQETGEVILPPTINLSSERLAPHGLYLIDDGQTQFLWVGRDAAPELINDVFGLADIASLQICKQRLPVLNKNFNERIRAIVEKSHPSEVGSFIVPHFIRGQ